MSAWSHKGIIALSPRVGQRAYDTYYVDATNGSDTNNGLGADAPWQTLGKVNTSANADTLLKRGEEFREDLIPPSDGTIGHPIGFGAYGSGADPIVNGALVVTGWTSYSGNTWQSAYTSDCQQAFMDDTLLTEGSDRDSLNDHEWVWVSNVLYLRDDTGDPDVTGVVVEARWENNVITLTGRSNLILRNLIVEKGKGWGIRINNGSMAFSNITLRNIEATEQYNGGMIVTGIDGLTLDNCSFHDSETNAGLYPSGATGITNLTVRRCAFYNNGLHGIGSNPNNGALSTGSLFECNLLYDNGGSGVNCGSEDGAVFQNNVIWGNGANGININTIPGGGFSSQNVKVYHNTIISDAVCLYVDDLCNGNIAKNNIFSTTDRCVNVVKDGANEGELTADYNQFDAPNWTATRFQWLGNDYDTLAQWKAGSGNDADSDDADPLFVNEVAHNYHLQVGSPCIGAGTTGLGVTHDFDGVLRDSENPDLGAYERVS